MRAPPHAGRMTWFRQVSWLAGHHSSPPSQTLALQSPVAFGEGLAADSCGDSSGLGSSSENGKPHRIPFWPVNATSTPELDDSMRAGCFCQPSHCTCLESVTSRRRLRGRAARTAPGRVSRGSPVQTASATVREMKVGPSRPAVRFWPQTAVKRSTYPFCQGAWNEVGRSRMPIARMRALNAHPNVLSLSRMRYFGVVSHRNASVIWRASHSAVGCVVTPYQSSLRRLWPSTKNPNRRSNVPVGTTKRSIDAIPSA